MVVLPPLTTWKVRREGNKEKGREIRRKGTRKAGFLATHYKCPIYHLQGHLGTRVAASEMHPVFLGTMAQ